MKEINLNKKLLLYILSGIVIIGIILAIVLSNIKDDSSKLIISANDFSVVEGESKTISYEVSNSKAEIKFRSRNTAIVTISDGEAFGVKEGIVEIVISARLSGEIYEKSVTVTVIKSGQDSGGDEPTKPPVVDPTPVNPGEDETPEIPEEPTNPSLNVEFTFKENCTVNADTITITKDLIALFTISDGENYEAMSIESNSSNLTACITNDIQRVFVLESVEVGTYSITIKLDNRDYEFSVVVSES